MKLDGSGQTVEGLKTATAGLDKATKKTSEEWARLKLLADKLDKIVERPEPVEEQRKERQIFGWGGFLAGALLVILGLWALPDGMETGVARMVMGTSYPEAGWRMMDARDEDWARPSASWPGSRSRRRMPRFTGNAATRPGGPARPRSARSCSCPKASPDGTVSSWR